MSPFRTRGREWNDIQSDEAAHGWSYVDDDTPLDFYDDTEDDYEWTPNQ